MSEVEKSQVTNTFLIDVIEGAGLEASFDEEVEMIAVNGLDFICYVGVDEERDLVKLRTWVHCKEGVQIDLLPEFVSKLNAKIIVQFSHTTYEDGRAYVDGWYYMPYKFGFNSKNFLYMLRRFSSIFIKSIREEDVEDVFFS